MARVLLVLLVVGGAVAATHPHPGYAKGPSREQRKLHKILRLRHYWQVQLKAEQHQEWVLKGQITSTHADLRTQKGQLRDEEAQTEARQAELESTINEYEARIESIQNQIIITRTEYSQVHAQASRMLAQLKRLKARIRKESGHVRQAIVEMYQLSQVSPLETVLEAKNLTEFLNQQDIVDQIGSHDAGILRWAEREHVIVHRLASGYISRMADLRALQAQKRIQLKLAVVDTQQENLLLIQARDQASRQQAGIEQTEAGIHALAEQERSQLRIDTSTEESAQKAIQQNEQSAERVAWIISQQTGVFPNIGTTGTLQWPLIGPITQGFGPSPYAFEPAVTYHGHYYPHFHTGIDIAAPFDTPIHAAGAGKVIFASLFIPGQVHASYGLCVIIMHSPTLSTLYAHMDIGLGLKVHVGEVVSAGQTIGYEGLTGNTTGPHLHFEVRINGVWVDPLLELPKEPTSD